MAGIDSDLLTYLDRHFKDVQESIHDLRAEMIADRERNSQRFHAIEQRFDAVENRLQKMEDSAKLHAEVGHNGGGGSARKIALGTGAAAGGGGIVYTVWDAITRHLPG